MDFDQQYKHLLPITLEVEEGKTYHWCSCGQSKTPPFCDRLACDDKGIPYQANLSEELTFCNCKQTKNPPFCDGSHAKLLLEAVKNKP